MAQGIWLRRRPRRIDDEVVAAGLGLKLMEYWRSVLRGRTMPARRDIDPVDLNRLLPSIFLIDVHTDPLRRRMASPNAPVRNTDANIATQGSDA